MKTSKISKAFPSALTGLLTLLALIGHNSVQAQGDKSKEPAKAAVAKLPPAKEVIAKFVTAIGGKEAYAKINSQHAKGKFEMAAQGIGGSLEVFAKRPDKLFVKMIITGIGDSLSGYDGQVGWSVDKLRGPALQNGKELDQTREKADFDHVLHDEKDFKSMETVEITQFEGKECYKLKLVTQSNSEMTEYYDTKTGLLVGSIVTQESALGPLVVTSISSDYKKFGDILFATKVVQKMGPLEQVLTINSLEFNKVADSVFELPAPIKALIKK